MLRDKATRALSYFACLSLGLSLSWISVDAFAMQDAPATSASSASSAAGDAAAKDRLAKYVQDVQGLKEQAQQRIQSGASEEDTARWADQQRHDLNKAYFDSLSADEQKQIFSGNLSKYGDNGAAGKYGDQYGPSLEYFTEKKQASWAQIIDSASKVPSQFTK